MKYYPARTTAALYSILMHSNPLSPYPTFYVPPPPSPPSLAPSLPSFSPSLPPLPSLPFPFLPSLCFPFLCTCEMLILDPLEPAVTITLKLLNSERLFCALLPVLSRASFRIRFTWFSKVCRSVLPREKGRA